MRGRQQVYLTIGCASNWPGCVPSSPAGTCPFFAGSWAQWDYVHPSCGPRGVCCELTGSVRACPFLGAVGLCPASCGRGACAVAGLGSVRACPFLAARTGGSGIMSIPLRAAGHVLVVGMGGWGGMSLFRDRTEQWVSPFFVQAAGRVLWRGPLGACPSGGASEVHLPAGRLKGAKPESSGILVSAFDSEAI